MDTFSKKIKRHLSKKDRDLMNRAIKKDAEESIDWDVLNYTHCTASNPITISASGGPYTFNTPGNTIVINNPSIKTIDIDSWQYERAKENLGQEKLLKLVLKDYIKQGKKIEALCIALKELKD